jgi:hypothetical protein
MNIAPYIYQLTDEYMWWYIHRLTDECTRVTDIFKNFEPAHLLLSPRALHSLHFDFDLVFFVSPLTTPLLPTPSSSTESAPAPRQPHASPPRTRRRPRPALPAARPQGLTSLASASSSSPSPPSANRPRRSPSRRQG